MMLAVMLTARVCTEVAAQGFGFQRESFPEGSYSPVTNVNRNGYPRVLSDGSVMFRVNAPQAQNVQIDLCGTKYDMQRAEDGTWTVTTKPQVPGMLTDTKTFNGQLDVFFVSCGEQDPRIEYTRNIVKKMRDGGVEVKFNSYPGDHEWQVWRKSLHEFAQYLFK